MKDKFILDACCGGRMFWFNKHHPNTIYIDQRTLPKGIIKQRPEFHVAPDLIADFRDLPYDDQSFRLIVWDPPHLKSLGENSMLRKKYGVLFASWREDIQDGFNELWRVLENMGVLIFKWNAREIPVNDVLELFHTKPLFGHTTGSKSQTHWLCFMKIITPPLAGNN